MDFSPDFLEAIVKKTQSSRNAVKVLSIEGANVLEAGENYTSEIKRLKLKVRCKDGQSRTIRLIAKIFPSTGPSRAMLLRSGMMDKEVKVYRDILPEMERLMEEKNIYSDCLWAKLVDYGVNRFILFEDLSDQDFKMVGRMKGLDYEHACLAMGGLARFHALSVLLIGKDLIQISDFARFQFCHDVHVMKRMYEVGLSSMINTIRAHWDKEWSDVADDMETLLTDITGKLRFVCRKKEDAFNVLCHGDPWTNNMLFKYCPFSGRPIGLKFVDFQLVHHGSYGLDINYTLYTSVQGPVRENKLDELIRVYYKTLVETFELFGYTPANLPTFEGVKEEVKRLKIFGVIVVCSLMHIFVAEKEDVQDLDELASSTDLKIPEKSLLSKNYTRRAQEVLGEFKGNKYFALYNEVEPN